MAKLISSLSLGAKIKDAKGNNFVVVAKDHYANKEVTLIDISYAGVSSMGGTSTSTTFDIMTNSVLALDIKNSYERRLDPNLAQKAKTTNVPYWYGRKGVTPETRYLKTKYFITSTQEMGLDTGEELPPKEATMSYLSGKLKNIFDSSSRWYTRTKKIGSSTNQYYTYDGSTGALFTISTGRYIKPTTIGSKIGKPQR
jgi:hypothetical protein